jgi:hypothetical protein
MSWLRARLRELVVVRRRFGYRRLDSPAREGMCNERLEVSDSSGCPSALELELPVGYAHRRLALPHPGNHRRLHPRVPSAGGRHLATPRSRAR